MIKQERFIDDNEGTGVNKFLEEIIDKYQLRKFYPEVEIRWRAVNYDLSDNHPTDDHIVQLICQNRLLALVYLRRDDWNYTEVTYIFIEDTLKKIEEFETRINQRINSKISEYN